MSKSECQEIFIYDNGNLLWKHNRANNKIKANSIAGNKRKDGYSDISIGNKKYLTHILIWNYFNGIIDGDLYQLDHIKQLSEGGDNSIDNLRLMTVAHNNQNRVAKNKSGYTNIVFRKDCITKPWQVTISQLGVNQCLSSLEEAIQYRNQIRFDNGMIAAKDRH